jgi:hypothetical protein
VGFKPFDVVFNVRTGVRTALGRPDTLSSVRDDIDVSQEMRNNTSRGSTAYGGANIIRSFAAVGMFL